VGPTLRMEDNLTNFEDCLGGCERILRTPIPVYYSRWGCWLCVKLYMGFWQCDVMPRAGGSHGIWLRARQKSVPARPVKLLREVKATSREAGLHSGDLAAAQPISQFWRRRQLAWCPRSSLAWQA
jgi:hypothetical protein